MSYFALSLVVWQYYSSFFFFSFVFYYFINALSIMLTLLLKVEDLTRMCKLYYSIPKCLDLVSTIFKQVSCFLLTFILMTKRTSQMFI